MSGFAVLVEMTAKPGKEAEIEAFLAREALLVKDRPGTLTWHAARVEGETGAYRVFDTFVDEAAREARLRGDPAPSNVFTAPHERSAVEAFAVGVINALLKPVTLDRLRHALERVHGRQGAPLLAKTTSRSEFWVRDGGDTVRIDVDRIDYVSAEGDYMRLHLGSCSYLLHSTLSQLERDLDAAAFLRVHRSALVAKRSIVAIGRSRSGKWVVRLRSGGEVCIGESYMARVRAFVKG
ncbi:LytTR family transcriptional regulator DNA-binding domain-containing protein [Sphingomonas sp. PAMC 26621]|uniref:LytTR family transcriptional regulator DNA-binding domain-containing protein n=1 Tax=Sphingomonas sp. PAMC 26621 TaxID=1112213 RepID=UPI0002885BE5|nr:LytTR family transcriptional regulator DNA-binding domain-containing protein [Sphingomonas sp. PAMC 26621]